MSFINYHFVFCPKYRRKIFLIPNLEDRFKELTWQKCKELKIEVLAMECHIDHVHLFFEVLAEAIPCRNHEGDKRSFFTCSSKRVPETERNVKPLDEELFRFTAGNVSSETIKWYVDTQKTRG